MHPKEFWIRRSTNSPTPLRSEHLNHNGSEWTRGLLTPLTLWITTLAVWLPWLGNVPLRDWDEGIVATVARATSQQTGLRWLLALKDVGEPYLNKPPALHWLIGTSIQSWGEGEWAVRAMPALVSTLAVPLLVLLRRELSRDQQGERSAIAAGLVLMTLLPMARHGRLAMLDGSLVSSSLMLWLGWLGSRRHGRYAVLAGLGCTGVLLLKPPALIGFAAIILAMGVLERVRQQHLSRNQQPQDHGVPISRRVSLLLLGASPGIAWHLWHGWWRGLDALLMWGGQGLSRVTTVVEGNQGSWLVPITEVLEGGWPWLLLLPAGFRWAWHHRHERAGLWELGLLVGSAALVLPLRTQLPWYSHLLWPAIALLCGEGLSQLLDSGKPRWVPLIWTGLGAGLLLAGSMTMLGVTDVFPPAPFLWAGIGLLMGGLWLRTINKARRFRGLVLLLIGWSLALLSLWHSRVWLWELNEAWDPRPIAAVIRTLPDDDPVYLQGSTRPSLGWYADRALRRRQSERPRERHWLITRKSPASCRRQTMSPDGDWQLWLCPETSTSPQERNENVTK